MNNILSVLEEYIQQHKEKSKENYNNYVKMKEEVERLTKENTTLRNDLFELSKELRNDRE
jgi:cell division protein FtsB